MSVKTILRKYECKSLLNSGREGDRMLQYILYKGGDQGYQDVLEICKVLGSKSELEVTIMYLDVLLETCHDAQTAIKMIQDFSTSSTLPVDGVELCRHVIAKAHLVIGLEMSQQAEECFVQVNVIKMCWPMDDTYFTSSKFHC